MATEVQEREYQGVQAPPVGTYTLDPSHTTIGFVAKHMMFTKVRGHFAEFDGTIVVGETPEESAASVTMKVESLTTGVEQRDAHLRSADFFEVETYPTITFETTGVEWVGANRLRVAGELTIRDVTRPVVLDAEYEGSTVDPWGGFRIGFSAGTEVDRVDWGITWNVALETGGLLVSKKIVLEIETQAVLRQEAGSEALAQAS